MTAVYEDNFQIYRDKEDFKRLAAGLGWRFGINFGGTFRRAANLGPFGSRPSTGLGESTTPSNLYVAAYRDTAANNGDKCTHVRFRAGAASPSYTARFGLTDDSILDLHANISAGQFNALDIEIVVNGASVSNPAPVRVYHRVPTAGNGATFNSLLLGEIPAVIANTSYTVETRVHLDGANSRLDVVWNGTLYSFPFDPARISSAWKATSFNTSTFLTSTLIYISDFVVYRDDATTPYPTGGMNVDINDASAAALKVSELNDDTVLVLDNSAFTDIPLVGASPTGEVISVRALARIAAGTGDQPIRAEIRATQGAEVFTVLDENIPVGAPVQLVHKKLPDSFRAAHNTIVLAARGKPGV